MDHLFKKKRWEDDGEMDETDRGGSEAANKNRYLEKKNSARSREQRMKHQKEINVLNQKIEAMEKKIVMSISGKAFSNPHDPFPMDLTRIPEVNSLTGKVVDIAGENQDLYYVIYWPAFSLDMSDYNVCRSRPGEITFVHQHILIPYATATTGLVDVSADEFVNRDRKNDVYCVRLANGLFVRMDKEFLQTLYAPISVRTGNLDNLIVRESRTMARIPWLIFEEKKKKEENKANSNSKMRGKN